MSRRWLTERIDGAGMGPAWCASTGNSGIGGTQGPVGDAALHAPEPGSARRRDSAA